MDYMGAALYPESLIRSDATFLRRAILGNTHSFSTRYALEAISHGGMNTIRSNSSQKSARCAEEARSSVLTFFDAPATEYTVVFTSNATGAMRLVGEAFPFVEDSSYVLGMDSHNSVNGIRQFALAKGARVEYIASTSLGGLNQSDAKVPISVLLLGRKLTLYS